MENSLDQQPVFETGSPAGLRRIALLVGIAYWSVLLVVLTGLAVLDGWETPGTFGARCINTVVAIAFTSMMARSVAGFRRGNFPRTASFVLALTLVCASVYFFITYYIFQLFGANDSDFMISSALRMILYWFAMFLGWSAMFLALLYSQQVKDREVQVSQLREQAHGAQMQALRYQINPHFLFNTLNAVAALIEERELPTAERMVLSLSAFLRSTLALDPNQDISLADELEIQSRYLEIERERFSDRLTVSVDIPDTLRAARVPSLILQPLVENAIKHGVNAIERSVQVRICAEQAGETVHIHVENDAPAIANVTSGTGVGLKNVAQRLAGRFGAAGRLSSGLVGDDIFRATVSLPLQLGRA